MKQVLLFTFLFILFSCTKDKKYPEHRSYVNKQIDQFSDTSFFSNIICMQYYENNLYVLDELRKDIVTLSKDLDINHVTGKGGPGPEELNIPTKFYVYNDTTYVLDAGGAYLKSYYKDQFLQSQQLKHLTSNKRFFYNFPNFYLSSVTDHSIFLVTDLTKENELSGGELISFETGKETIMRNGRHLLFDEKYFYAVSDNLPSIQKYDLKTMELILDFNLSDIPIIRKNLNHISLQKDRQNSFYVFIEDAYLVNESLFLLCAELGHDYKVNQLIRIALYPEIAISEIYILPGSLYQSFCVSSDYIFAFDSQKGTIDRIKLKN